MEEITQEDVIDALVDTENAEGLDLLTQFYEQHSKEGGFTIATRIKSAMRCAQMLYDAKRYEDVVAWLDTIATRISDEDGPDSEEYSAFVEDEGLDTLRMKATDKIFGEDEGEEGFEDEDE